MKVSICIATYERPHRLDATLAALASQARLPDEIVISDASKGQSTRDLVERHGAGHSGLTIRYVPSERRALPWQRWWAFTHSTGDVVLFIDDDVRLHQNALQHLERAYESLGEELGAEKIAGIGFILTYPGGQRPKRDQMSAKERWLKTARCRSATVTSGGLTVSHFGLEEEPLVEVDYLWGGAMSYRRHVLERIGLLDQLVALYEAGIGRGEDGVLSSYARREGSLFLLTGPLAIHPLEPESTNRPYPQGGWHKGITVTFSRAHTMRWLAQDPRSYRAEWVRLVSLEIGRAFCEALKAWRCRKAWENLCGTLAGSARAVLRWRAIPPEARTWSSDDPANLTIRGRIPMRT